MWKACCTRKWGVIFVVAAVSVVLLPGCLSDLNRERPFSEDWARQVHKEQEFKARKVRIDGEKRANMNDGGAIGKNDETAPAYSVGPQVGLGADLDMDKAGLRYGWK